MPQDHFVAQTYLKAFADPVTIKDPEKGGQIHAYSKAEDGKHFTPFAGSICKMLDWDQNPMLSPADALGQWLKMFEPHWAAAADRLATTHHLSTVDKFLIAGYWAYLSTCTPTWHRISTQLQQEHLDEVYLQKFIEYVEANSAQFPDAAKYIPMVKAGSLKATIDSNYPKAVVTKQLLQHLWFMFHQEWNVIYNDSAELFVTSDNPSCFDHQYGAEIHPARYLPATPRLALWANIEMKGIPETIDPNIPPLRKSFGREATPKFIKDMNVLIIKSAERFVLSAVDRPFLPFCVKKYKNWWVSRAATSRIPADDGYYEVIQTRAMPRNQHGSQT
jgi:hypothetical protein